MDQQNTHCPSEITQYLLATKIQEDEKQADGKVYATSNGTKSTTALGSVGNLIAKDAPMNQTAANSQLMFVRGSIGNSIHQTTTVQTLQNLSNSNRLGTGAQMVNAFINNQGGSQQTQFKNSKSHNYEKQQMEKKGTAQGGLFPRISNLRNEVNVLFKNSNNSQQNGINQLIQGIGQRGQGTPGISGKQIKPPSPRSDKQRELLLQSKGSFLYNQSLIGTTGSKIMAGNQQQEELQDSTEFNVKSSKMRKRIKSKINENEGQPPSNSQLGLHDSPQINKRNLDDDSFHSDLALNANKQYFSEKYPSHKGQMVRLEQQMQQRIFKDDMSLDNFSKNGVVEDGSSQPAMTPQIMSSQINKRHQSQQDKALIGPQNYGKQHFFARRAGSNKEGVMNISQPGYQTNEYQASFDEGEMVSPQNETVFKVNHLNNNYENNLALRAQHDQKSQLKNHIFPQDSQSMETSPSKKMEAALQQEQQQQQTPKIPVICGFHKRVLLLTSQVGVGSQPQGGMSSNAMSKRIRNKNPNCNHNNNSVFYQPSYNNVKYDDSYKKKEEVLRKVFFKECAKEEEKRNPMASTAQLAANKNDPLQYLKVIEEILSLQIFAEYECSLTGEQRPILVQIPQLIIELGVDTALVAHKAFLLALIKAGKIINENMFKVLHDFKTSANEYDPECIYCKYSHYALRESSKVQNMKNVIPMSIETPMDPNYQISADPKIENLVRMFQSQLFKRSFINTSLMIIQRKMNEKNQIKAKTANTTYHPEKELVSKPLERKKKEGETATAPKKNNVNKSMTGGGSTNLEYIASQMQKLAKNLANPKDKEKYLELKEKYYREFLNKINLSNGATIPFPKASFTPYKYYIGRGNNSVLVRNCLKQRFWWSMGDFDEWDEYHFLWTQWKSNKILSLIKTNADVTQQVGENSRSVLNSAGGVGGSENSMLSTQVTVTDKDSNSSVENLLSTPTRRKRASTLPQNQQSAIKRGNTGSFINSSATKNANSKAGKDDAKEPNLTSHAVITYNHMENNFHLSNKKALYYNMKVYYESTGQDWWQVLPLTFHIKEGVNDKEFAKFTEFFRGEANSYGNIESLGKQIWIVKPGENTNRGCGIQVCRELDQIKDLIKNTTVNGQKRSYIVQKYIEKPLLYKNRKFDIRCYALITCVNGNLQGYWYNEGYLRTSSKDFNLKNVTNRLIHLTNDAVQKKSDDYGKFENGNKISYLEFQKYLDNQNIKCNFVGEIIPQFKKIATDTIKAVSRKIDPNRRHNTFEIFGYDFMIDEDLKPWLIEVNTNPCLELSAPLLGRLIPAMVENAVKIAIDPLFPPPPWPNSKKHNIPDATDNKFELVFNESVDGPELKNLPIDDTMNGIIEEDEMEDQGTDDEDDGQ